ncbi:MAG: hypothetical protein BGN87_00330 [Rhizobiales bacterium 65-79]|nr:hypothetical protein [Hyphomicrobiales bacterium]OJU02629.1 MAG: hypothetical protein BGN87_00330 [Rhizobiales bacterium 65-79]
MNGVQFAANTPIVLPLDLAPGADFYVSFGADNNPVATAALGLPDVEVFAGFHFAPGGNAVGRSGGDEEPAINPFSCWDAGFRPACPDPRGMAIVDLPHGKRVWVDIYKLGVDHIEHGTSRFGVKIADGNDLPQKIGGKGRYRALDYKTAVEIYAHHGKQLLSFDEFRAAAFGVTEKIAAGNDPKITGLDAARTSQRGIMQATGNLWDWGHDGDPDDRRPSIFGGSWWGGDDAGSRDAYLVHWAGHSGGLLSARGRSDHLTPE